LCIFRCHIFKFYLFINHIEKNYDAKDNIIFLGEIVLNYQSWVEGSIKTVDNFIAKIKNENKT
jgi:hypothetical protein